MDKGPDTAAGGRVAAPGSRITVVGAGIVGVCCGLYLLRRGHRVSIVDYQQPGEGSSYGNAGFISPGSCAPVGMPGLAAKVPGMLLDPLGPLTIRWRADRRTGSSDRFSGHHPIKIPKRRWR